MPHADPTVGALAVLRYERRRARAQWRFFMTIAVIALAVMLAALYWGVPALAVVFGLLFTVSVLTAIVTRSQAGALSATVTPKGLWLAIIDEMVPWTAIGSLTVIRYTMANGTPTPGTPQHPATGSKQINLIPKDLAYFTMLLSSNYDFRITPSLAWEPRGTAGVNADFTAAASDVDWLLFVAALQSQANRHGIPLRFTPPFVD